jgi:hypothetical protein
MFIITIVSTDKHEVKIHDVYEDEMTARDRFIKLAVECTAGEDRGKTYEAMHVGINEIHIFRKVAGYLVNSKDLFKILVLHEYNYTA